MPELAGSIYLSTIRANDKIYGEQKFVNFRGYSRQGNGLTVHASRNCEVTRAAKRQDHCVYSRIDQNLVWVAYVTRGREFVGLAAVCLERGSNCWARASWVCTAAGQLGNQGARFLRRRGISEWSII
jgi:hypothetical protein